MLNLTLQIQLFLDYCKSRKFLNDKTIKAYRIDLKQFAECTDNVFSKETICHYINTLHEQFKPKTVKRKIASVKAFTHYLLIEDVIESILSTKSMFHLKNRSYFLKQFHSMWLTVYFPMIMILFLALKQITRNDAQLVTLLFLKYFLQLEPEYLKFAIWHLHL